MMPFKEEVKNNKKLTKDMLIDSGEKINKFYQERLKYLNELKYELERNSKLLKEIEEKDNFIYEQTDILETM